MANFLLEMNSENCGNLTQTNLVARSALCCGPHTSFTTLPDGRKTCRTRALLECRISVLSARKKSFFCSLENKRNSPLPRVTHSASPQRCSPDRCAKITAAGRGQTRHGRETAKTVTSFPTEGKLTFSKAGEQSRPLAHSLLLRRVERTVGEQRERIDFPPLQTPAENE